MRYTLKDISTIVGADHFGSDNIATHIGTDSRNNLPSNTLFVAIQGIFRDGHSFIWELIGRGVFSFLLDRENPLTGQLLDKLPQGVGVLVVDDSLRALQRLAAYHRSCFGGEVVAITGSNGKTIVKEWIASLWDSQNGKLVRSPRSYNSQLGVALSLLQIEGDERVAVIEAGISKVGEMEILSEMIRPDVVIFTNLGTAHQENFASPQEHLRQKELLFEGARTVIRSRCDGNIQQQNLSCVLQLYDLLGINPKSLDNLPQVAMRLEVQQGVLGSLIINDSYNSDIDSLRIALDFARAEALDRELVVVLSDILESSLDDQVLYERIASLLEEFGIRHFVGVGEGLMRHSGLFAGGQFFGSCEEFLDRFEVGSIASRAVLIKGSRPFGFERISRALESRVHTTVMEVNLSALRDNLNRYRSQLSSGVRTMAMVKASGYGTGSVGVARLLQQSGVDYLAVAFADEGVELRRGGIYLPIVVLNADNGSFATMIEHRLEPEIYSMTSLEQYLAEARAQGVGDLPIHIKIDSGMHRLGFMEDQIEGLCGALTSQNQLYVASIFSHLAAADMPEHDEFTHSQISCFDRLSGMIIERLADNNGGHRVLRHICNTSGIERFAEAHYDMVRVGIGLYSGEIEGNSVVCRLLTRIVQIKKIPLGDTVGYCRMGVIEAPSRIAIIPIGYADGLSRALGRGAISFKINGMMAPTIGNICMDTTILDITALEGVSEGDRVEIFGGDGTLSEMARVCGTIDYEILTSVSSRIKRLYIND